MNAKKIMGAVLVALLAAALFVGAGAAAMNMGTVFVNQAIPNDPIVDFDGDGNPDIPIDQFGWTDSTGAAVTMSKDPMNNAKVYFPKAGIYTADLGAVLGEYSITVVSPTATISGVAGQATGNENTAYPFIPGTYYVGTEPKVSILPGATVFVAANNMKVYVTDPNGDTIVNGDVLSIATINKIQDVLYSSTNNDYKPVLGEYSITVVYEAGIFVNGTTVDMQKTVPVTFKVAEAGDVTISASADQVLKSEPFTVKVTGQPGAKYEFKFDTGAFSIDKDQIGFVGADPQNPSNNNGVTTMVFTMPNTGYVELVVKAGNDAGDSEKLTVQKNGVTKPKTASVTVKFTKGTISLATDAASYFIGDKVKITGTSTAGSLNETVMVLKGTNFENATLGNAIDFNKNGKNIEFIIDTSVIVNAKAEFAGKKLDVGAYTLTVIVGDDLEKPYAKATVVISLKQPFISIVEAPEVIVKDTKAKFIINAEATTAIQYYIFGTNYFNASAEVTETVEDAENQFTFTLNEEFTKKMDAGQYFMVVQHPMYDEVFNIYADDFTIYLRDLATQQGDKLFDVELRQTANAAQALCDALDTQNIDDMYVKYSFFVVGEDESFTISDIPETIAQGETLTISGVSTSNAEEYVTVEMISTAFAAVPKETVGSASFIAVTTQVAEDGTWEVTFDTSNLNVDEYSLKVACGDKTWKNVEINVVEAGDEPVDPEQPGDEPEQPGDEPVAPATPGFGALAALAGLGAVAVLLLRRE